MKKSKKIINVCIAFGVGILLLTGCGSNRNISESSKSVDSTPLNVQNATNAPLSINQKITQLIEKGKYEDAQSLFPSQMDSSLKEIYYINNALQCDKSFNSTCVASYLVDLINYSGTLKPQVDTLMSKYHSDMIDITNDRKSKGVSKNQEPYIGMTKDDLLNFSWGKPDDINKTITKNGTDEQWVYRHKGYVYLTDGKVTAIQTH